MTEPRIAVVTGAGTGIGRAAAIALGKAGYTVVLAGRRKDLLAETETAIAAAGGASLAVATDVADPVSVQALFATIRERFARLDLLFNNAGINAPASPIEDVPLETWREVVDINLTGTFLCTQEAIRIMKAQEPRGGRIINNGSIAAYAPRPLLVAYTATKHAITGLTRQTALDGRVHDIACGQIDIGNAATPLTEGLGQSIGLLQPNGERMVEPSMAAEKAGEAVAYMASLPLDTNVLFMTVMATKMPFVGRG